MYKGYWASSFLAVGCSITKNNRGIKDITKDSRGERKAKKNKKAYT